MTSFLRSFLFLLLAVPAAAVPQGMSLSWCLCLQGTCWEALGAVETSCCAPADELACCCAPEESAPAVDHGAGTWTAEDHRSCGDDCSKCHEVDVDPFEPGLERELDVLVPPALPAGLASTEAIATPTCVAPCALRTTRAPPGAVRPSGLRPGALPLRL